MRIFGGRDYYDCALSLGIDPTITLVREKSRAVLACNVDFSLPERELRTVYRNWSRSSPRFLPAIDTLAVAFCGKVYHGATFDSECFWSESALTKWLEQSNHKWFGVEVEQGWKDRRTRARVPTLAEYFAPRESAPVLRDWMIREKVSILVAEPPLLGYEREYQVNPTCLKRIGFARALDPYTAFQELSMWIGGVLGGTSPEMVRITDDRVLAEGHGFDKFSFRGPRLA